MIKMFEKSLALPLKMIYETALNDCVFPDDWKKGNIVPVYTKGLKTMLINYCPISLLPIFPKMFKKILFTSLFILPKINFSQFVRLVFFQVILALQNS